MADQNIALGVQVPDAMKSISGMLNFAGQAQQLRSAQQQYERGGVALEQERALLKPNIAKGEAESETAQTGARSASFKLAGDQQAKALQIVGGLFNDPRIKANDPEGIISAAQEARDQMIQAGVPKANAEWQASQIMSRAHQPGAAYQLIQNAIQQNAGSGTQAGVINTPVSLVSTGGEIKPIQTQPGAPGGMQPGSPAIPQTIPPGSLETTEQGPDGQKYIVTRSPQGTILSTRPLAGGQAGGTGGGPGMPRYSPGDAEAVPVLEAERNQARNILGSAPVAHAANEGILEEIDKVTTGALGPKLQGLFSTLGAKYGTAEERASAYDLVGKYLERNAIEAAKSMGPHTNAGLESAIKANGSVAYNPTAIKKLTKLNDAIISGAEAYQPGLEKAISANPQRGVLAKREFDQSWAQNFDPNIYIIERAQMSGDKATIDEVKKKLGNSGVRELIRKAVNIEKLSQQGRL